MDRYYKNKNQLQIYQLMDRHRVFFFWLSLYFFPSDTSFHLYSATDPYYIRDRTLCSWVCDIVSNGIKPLFCIQRLLCFSFFSSSAPTPTVTKLPEKSFTKPVEALGLKTERFYCIYGLRSGFFFHHTWSIKNERQVWLKQWIILDFCWNSRDIVSFISNCCLSEPSLYLGNPPWLLMRASFAKLCRLFRTAASIPAFPYD